MYDLTQLYILFITEYAVVVDIHRWMELLLMVDLMIVMVMRFIIIRNVNGKLMMTSRQANVFLSDCANVTKAML